MMDMKKIIIIYFAGILILSVIAGLVVANLASQIDKQGGAATSIGRFVHDVNKAATEK